MDGKQGGAVVLVVSGATAVGVVHAGRAAGPEEYWSRSRLVSGAVGAVLMACIAWVGGGFLLLLLSAPEGLLPWASGLALIGVVEEMLVDPPDPAAAEWHRMSAWLQQSGLLLSGPNALRTVLLLAVCLMAGCAATTEAPQFGQEVVPPRGWLDCRRAGRAECQSQVLDEVLERGRSLHTFVSDRQKYGKSEDWRAELNGDCDGFALWCRQELRQHGINALLAFARVQQGARKVGHLVCMTPDGHVLDNRHSRVAHWQSDDYEWISVGPFEGGVWRQFSQR